MIDKTSIVFPDLDTIINKEFFKSLNLCKLSISWGTMLLIKIKSLFDFFF